MQYLGFVLVLLAAFAPFGAIVVAEAKPAPAYCAMLMRGKA